MLHYPFGPSQLSRRMSCHASYQMERPLPDPPPKVDSIAGTTAHDLASTCLLISLDTGYLDDPYVYIDDICKETGKKFTRDMAEAVEEYLHYVFDIIEDDDLVFVETLFKGFHLDSEFGGTPDCIILRKGKIICIDFKFGFIKHIAEWNAQLLGYILMAYKTHTAHQFEQHIVQPRINNYDGWSFRYPQLLSFQQHLKSTFREARKDNPSFGPSEEGCRWCKYAPKCVALHKHHSIQLTIDFDDDLPRPRDLTLAESVRIVNHKSQFLRWFEAVELNMIHATLQGEGPESKKVIQNYGKRKWKKNVTVASLARDLGVSPSKLAETKLKTPTQLEASLKRELKKYWTREKSKLLLVDSEDKRLAVTTKADFEG